MKKEILILILSTNVFLCSCKEYLEIKPNKALLVPTTAADFQALLDNTGIMNVAPYLNCIANDDQHTSDSYLQSTNPLVRNSYIWANEVYEDIPVSDWSIPYEQIFYANIVLAGVEKLNESEAITLRLKGSALFFRAMAYYNLCQTFTKPFEESTSGSDSGLPLRLIDDVNDRPSFSNLKQVYHQILNDLSEASKLLPDQTDYKSRPTKAAAFALLSRVYLTMGDYNNVILSANSCLSRHDKLIDYNDLIFSTNNPFPVSLPNRNDEVIFQAQLIATAYFAIANSNQIDLDLYKSYEDEDLRKAMFFRDRGNDVITFKGNYSGSTAVFAGLAVDEVYLNRAEAYARIEDFDKAAQDIDNLLKMRWEENSYAPVVTRDKEELLKFILTERRKELVYRNMRWADLKRLNKEPAFAKQLTRTVNGQQIVLSPEDKRYIFPIPNEELNN